MKKISMEMDKQFCFMIGSLISADNNLSNEERKNNIILLKKILKGNVFILNKEKKKFIKQGIKLLKKEIKING